MTISPFSKVRVGSISTNCVPLNRDTTSPLRRLRKATSCSWFITSIRIRICGTPSCGVLTVSSATKTDCPVRAAARPEKSEEFQMEQTNTPQRPQQDGAAPAESAKRRRRRGGRRQKSGGQGPAAASQAPQKKESAPQAQPQQPQKEKLANGAPRGKNGRGEKAEHAPRAEKSAKSAKEEPRFSEVDDSIQLIARRAPAQKYASFEEYMKAHEE